MFGARAAQINRTSSAEPSGSTAQSAEYPGELKPAWVTMPHSLLLWALQIILLTHSSGFMWPWIRWFSFPLLTGFSKSSFLGCLQACFTVQCKVLGYVLLSSTLKPKQKFWVRILWSPCKSVGQVRKRLCRWELCRYNLTEVQLLCFIQGNDCTGSTKNCKSQSKYFILWRADFQSLIQHCKIVY